MKRRDFFLNLLGLGACATTAALPKPEPTPVHIAVTQHVLTKEQARALMDDVGRAILKDTGGMRAKIRRAVTE